MGGTTSQLVDVRDALRHDVEHVFPLALGIVAVILALLLRALIAPIYLLIGVMLTYVATLGIITLVFLDGLGFVGLDFTIPIVVYLFVMAIGTDYNILIASRLREGFVDGLDPREASRLAIVHGSPAVGAASLILAGTFASLLLTGIQLLEEIGLAVALGVLLAANVLATRIVPTLAAMRPFHFWWPHHVHHRTATSRDELLGASGGRRRRDARWPVIARNRVAGIPSSAGRSDGSRRSAQSVVHSASSMVTSSGPTRKTSRRSWKSMTSLRVCTPAARSRSSVASRSSTAKQT